MCCDHCDMWIHVSCDQYFTEEQYHYLVENPSSDPWFCSVCTARPQFFSDTSQSNSVVSSGRNLNRLYFNAHSIFPKRFDLAAYLATSVNTLLTLLQLLSLFWIPP